MATVTGPETPETFADLYKRSESTRPCGGAIFSPGSF
jgi:hypothetical protein